MSELALALLTALSATTALALARRANTDRADRLIATSVIWNFLVALPIYGLGLANQLTRTSLGATVGIQCTVLLLGLAWREGAGEFVKSVGRAWRDLLSVPWQALKHPFVERSPVFLAVPMLLTLCGYFFVMCFIAPAKPLWDGIWYHETIVAATIQEHGFGPLALPAGLQDVNGTPRFSQMTQLWYAIFAGRKLVELPSVLFLPLGMASVYGISFRYTRDRSVSLAWAMSYCLMPVNLRQVGTCLVDTHGAALLLGGLYFVTQAKVTLRDAWLAVMALTMAMGTKVVLLVPAGTLCLIEVGRLIHASKRLGVAQTWLTILGGFVCVVAMLASVHLRNYWNFGNPLWPHSPNLQAVGIEWPTAKNQTSISLTSKAPPDQLLVRVSRMPFHAGKKLLYNTANLVDYGPGMLWGLVPIGALAFFASIIARLRYMVRRFRGRETDPERTALTTTMIFVVITIVLELAVGPAAYAGRYHIALFGMFVALVSWTAIYPGWRRVSEQAAAATLVFSIAMLAWTSHDIHKKSWINWYRSPEKIAKLWKATPEEREVNSALGGHVQTPRGRLRETELGPGDLVMFDDITFASLLWNNDYSNVVRWFGKKPKLKNAEKLNAKWLYIKSRSLRSKVAKLPQWQRIGKLEKKSGHGHLYRRVADGEPTVDPALAKEAKASKKRK
ncbi:MAG: hypothetical protein HRU17_18040, partial [Polyangiaceae bacterium]|nr:hypothetical protein [Polyangiaceae bacterium]